MRWCIDGGARLPKANGTAAGASNEEIKSTSARGVAGGEETRRTISLRASFVPRILSRGPLDAAFSSGIIDNCRHVDEETVYIFD